MASAWTASYNEDDVENPVETLAHMSAVLLPATHALQQFAQDDQLD
jgi:hypothetical protein